MNAVGFAQRGLRAGIVTDPKLVLREVRRNGGEPQIGDALVPQPSIGIANQLPALVDPARAQHQRPQRADFDPHVGVPRADHPGP